MKISYNQLDALQVVQNDWAQNHNKYMEMIM